MTSSAHGRWSPALKLYGQLAFVRPEMAGNTPCRPRGVLWTAQVSLVSRSSSRVVTPGVFASARQVGE